MHRSGGYGVHCDAVKSDFEGDATNVRLHRRFAGIIRYPLDEVLGAIRADIDDPPRRPSSRAIPLHVLCNQHYSGLYVHGEMAAYAPDRSCVDIVSRFTVGGIVDQDIPTPEYCLHTVKKSWNGRYVRKISRSSDRATFRVLDLHHNRIGPRLARVEEFSSGRWGISHHAGDTVEIERMRPGAPSDASIFAVAAPMPWFPPVIVCNFASQVGINHIGHTFLDRIEIRFFAYHSTVMSQRQGSVAHPLSAHVD